MAHVVVKSSEMLAPAYDAAPLGTALANTNALYEHHRPNLLPAVYTVEPGVTRITVFQSPIRPSADDLTYYFEHVLEQTAGTGTLTVLVEEWTGAAWNTIENTGAIAFSGITTHTHSDTIDATATILRITYETSDGATTYTAHSIAVLPAPSAPTGGTLACGFKHYDSTLLATTGAPINTEMINRVPSNVAAILADRSACVLSFLQEDNATDIRHDAANGYKPDGVWQTIGYAVASIPFAKYGDTVSIDVLASVDAGATTDLVQVAQDQAFVSPATFDASGSVEAGTLTIDPIDAGTPSARCIFRIDYKNTAGNTTYLHAVTGSIVPTVPAGWVIVSGVSPPGELATLQATVAAVEKWAFRPWPQPALCYEGNTSGLSTRRFNLSVGLGVNHARAWITRCHVPPGYGAAQAATVIGTDSSGGFSGNDLITVPAMSGGNESYLDAASVGQARLLYSGDLVKDGPTTTVNRQIELTEGLSPTVETIEVDYSAGFGLVVVGTTKDRETL